MDCEPSAAQEESENETANLPWQVPWWGDGTGSGSLARDVPAVLEGKEPAFIKLGLEGNPWWHFYWISNQLGSPKVLVCPSDKEKRQASDFNTSPDGGFLHGNYRNNAVSYWLNLDAGATMKRNRAGSRTPTRTWEDAQQHIVYGDRNVRHIPRQWGESDRCGWTGIYANGSFDIPTQADWIPQATYGHGSVGNVSTADGSVQAVSRAELREFINPSDDGNANIHILYPE